MQHLARMFRLEIIKINDNWRSQFNLANFAFWLMKPFTQLLQITFWQGIKLIRYFVLFNGTPLVDTHFIIIMHFKLKSRLNDLYSCAMITPMQIASSVTLQHVKFVYRSNYEELWIIWFSAAEYFAHGKMLLLNGWKLRIKGLFVPTHWWGRTAFNSRLSVNLLVD